MSMLKKKMRLFSAAMVSVMLLTMFTICPPEKVYAYDTTERLANQGFETVNGGAVWKLPTTDMDWGITYNGTTISSSIDEHHGGTKSLKIDTTNSSANPYISQTVSNVSPGATYTLSAWLKSYNAMLGNGAAFRYLFYDGSNYVSSYTSSYFNTDFIDGSWHQATTSFTIPQAATKVVIYLQLYGAGTVYYDDASLMMKTDGTPPKFFLSPNSTFLYSDWSTGTVHAEWNSVDYTIPSGSYIDFVIKKDGVPVDGPVSKNTAADTQYTFSTSILTALREKYTVEATLKDSGGSPLWETQSIPIYRYDRPTNLRSDGVYLDNGQPFFPVIAYHPILAQYPICSQVGVNVVQSMNTDASVSSIKTYLDTAQANNLKVLVRLYTNMKPAGHQENIDATINAVTTLKDHLAVYGWMIMDEPNLRTMDAQNDLIDSYKAIRDIDPVHPTYMTENLRYYYKSTGRCTDILAIDPYPLNTSPITTISDRMDSVVAAVNNLKPVYDILQTFTFTGYPYLPTINEVRNMAYQAMWRGAKGIGYYSFTDSGWDLTTSVLWSGLIDFNNLELENIAGYFVTGTVTHLGQSDTGNVWWKTWQAGEDVYAVAMNRTTSMQTVDIPMPNSYMATLVNGSDGDDPYTIYCANNNLHLSLSSSQVIVYKQTNELLIDNDLQPVGYAQIGSGWTQSTATTGYNGSATRYSANLTDPYATYTPDIDISGNYDVYVYKIVVYNSDKYTGIDIVYSQGATYTVTDPQILDWTTGSKEWVKVTTSPLPFSQADNGKQYLKIKRTAGSTGVIRADAVKFVKVN